MSSKVIDGESELIRLDDPQDDVAIKFDHVTKRYRLYENEQQRLASIFWARKKRKEITTICANDDLSFEIKRGEAVAFLGANGAGKSTALKMVTGVSYPSKGTVTVNGRVSALLELTAGFDSKMTGRENIYLRGQALGFSMDELKAMEQRVVDFADIGVYIDQPVRMYSSGMRARLGFGFAVASNPEILVVDEALSVGDRAFRKKCNARVREIMEDENVTVLFVTHSSKSAREFCTRGIVLEHGKKKFDGPIQEAIAFYDNMVGED
ncbi:MAG: ABC transporter ATP-binding protein [Adlercreutzia sp.]|nr:ABC transporter ATP-binding protein [Adlercreutzia sp.]